MTAHAIRGDRERCLAAGMDDYLCKPFVWKELATVLKRWLPAFAQTVDQMAGEVTVAAPTRGEALPIEPAVMTPDHSPAVLDVAVLESIRKMQQNGSPRLMERLIDLYQRSASTLLEQLRGAANTGGNEGLRIAAAHTLKSSSANIGAIRMQKL